MSASPRLSMASRVTSSGMVLKTRRFTRGLLPQYQHLRRDAAVALERELHVVGRHEVSVVEAHALAQREFASARPTGVSARPAGCAAAGPETKAHRTATIPVTVLKNVQR